MPDEYLGMLDTADAADVLGLTVASLATYRWRGTSPPWTRHRGRVLYRRADLDRWLRESR